MANMAWRGRFYYGQRKLGEEKLRKDVQLLNG